jgi:hypothetical protein
MSATKKVNLFINTAPRAYVNKETGTTFWTVLVGIAKDVLSAKGVSEAQVGTLKVEMTIFPEKVSAVASSFAAAKAAGLKLVLKCDEFTLTDIKPNNFVTKDGVAVTGFKAWVWPEGEKTLDVLGSSMNMSEELRKLLEEFNGEEDGDIL